MDADTSDMADLTVPWRSVCFFFVPKLFLLTYAVNYDTIIVLCYCGIPPKTLSVMPVCVRNVHHISRLPDYLDTVALSMPLVASILTLVMITRR